MKCLQIALLLAVTFFLDNFANGAQEESRVKRAFIPYRTGKAVASQVSNALDHLLFFSGYDKRIRPQVKPQNLL